MEFVIREAYLSDTGAIARLSREELGYDYPAEETAKKLHEILNSSRDKVYVAVADDAVVGYIHANMYDVLYFPTMTNIMGLAVSGEWRRNGIGRALIEAAESWARQTGSCGVRLNSGASRKEAHEFYRNCGFDSEKGQIRFLKLLRNID